MEVENSERTKMTQVKTTRVAHPIRKPVGGGREEKGPGPVTETQFKK